jgi:carbonic anhydrase/acetyltransferase-like protein (isoleucine patch superfamily)
MDEVAKLKDSLTPDFSNPPSIRKKRAPKHDFKDGNGRVFAHRHDHGGGWVADTAWVAPTAKVTRNAQVYGFARVADQCEITGASRVYGRARLFDRVQLHQCAEVSGCAKVMDRSTLYDDAQVTDNALVCGSSSFTQRVYVANDALVHNTRIAGPPKNGRAMILDSARVLNCVIEGHTRVENASLCENTGLRNARVHLTARLVHSNLHGNLSARYYLYAHGSLELNPGEPTLESQVVSFSGAAYRSAYFGHPAVIGPNVHLFHSTFRLDGEEVNDYFAALNYRFVDVNAYNLDAIRRLVEGPQPQLVAVPVPPSRPASFDSVGQRRIMRMEETS